MTESLFDASYGQRLVERIQQLSASDRPAWGKLSLAGMLAHCRAPLAVAAGELKLSRSWIGRLFGRLAKKSLTSAKPFAKNMPTDPRLLVASPRAFEVERGELLTLVQSLRASGPAGLTREPHPFFGPLTSEEWGLLLGKHLDHHLRQFGR